MNRRSIAVVALAALLAGAVVSPASAIRAATPVAQTRWVAANGGLSGATALVLAHDPNLPAVRYAGTYRGFARSTDSGAHWAVANRGLPPGCQINALLPVREHPATLLAGCAGADYGNGLYRSLDRGRTWAHYGDGMLGNGAVYALLEETDGAQLAGTVDGIYRSTDAGRTWSRTLHGNGEVVVIYSLARDPFSPLTYYATSAEGVYKSVDAGITWFAGTNGLEELGNTAIDQVVADPTRQGRLFLATDGSGIYRSIDGAGSWQHLDNAPDHAYSLLVQPMRAAPSGALTPDLRAQPAGQAPGSAKGKGATGAKKSTTVRRSAPGETALVLAGTDNGVQVSADGGETWYNRTEAANGALPRGDRPFSGLPDGASVCALLSFGRSAEVLAGTATDGIWDSNDLGRSWRPGGSGLQQDSTITAVAVDPAKPGAVYYGTDGSGVKRSGDSGATLADASSGLPEHAAIDDLLIQPSRRDRLVAALGTPSGGIAISDDGAATWQVVGLQHRFVNVVIADAHDTQTLYAGLAHGGIGWSADGGEHWRLLTTGLPGAAEILSLAVDPHDALRLLAGTTRGLYVSADQGDHWLAAGTGLPPGPIAALLHDPQARHGFLAGTSTGLYRSADGGATWARAGLPRLSISRLARDPSAPRTVLAATSAGIERSVDDGRHWAPLNAGFPSVSAAVAVAPAGPVTYASNAYGAYFLSPTGPVAPRSGVDAQYFGATGHTVGGPFLAFWKQHGGLAVFGYPLTEAIEERGLHVQYFERARFEYHATGSSITLTSLGSVFAHGRAFTPIKPFPNGPLRIYVSRTHHSIATPFLAYWRAHGGAAVFGFPISEVLHEANGDGTGNSYTLQYFQNARIEYHPEHKGTPYEIELGNLGRQYLIAGGWLQ